MVCTLFGTVTSVSPAQFWNAYCPMFVTLFGIESVRAFEQPEKAYSPRLVTPSVIGSPRSPVQFWNAYESTVPTLAGSAAVRFVIPLPPNA